MTLLAVDFERDPVGHGLTSFEKGTRMVRLRSGRRESDRLVAFVCTDFRVLETTANFAKMALMHFGRDTHVELSGGMPHLMRAAF